MNAPCKAMRPSPLSPAERLAQFMAPKGRNFNLPLPTKADADKRHAMRLTSI